MSTELQILTDEQLDNLLNLPIYALNEDDWTILYLNNKIDFETIPPHLATQKAWFQAILKKETEMEKLPKRYSVNDIAKAYYEKYQTLEGIADRGITEEMALDYFNKHQTVQFIPERYINEPMAQISFYNNGETKYIPLRLWDREMAQADYKKYQDLTRIPARFIRNQEIANQKFEKTQDVFSVPFEFRTPEMVKKARRKNPQFFSKLSIEEKQEIIEQEVLTVVEHYLLFEFFE